MSVYYNKEGQRWLYSYESNDIVGLKDPDGSERLFIYTVPNTETIAALLFDTAGAALSYCDGDPDKGAIWWCPEDDTFSIQHSNGVRQQVGEESYMRVVNHTGATIPNGTVVGFAGVDDDRYIEVAPYLADGGTPVLYCVGVTTESIADNEKGRVTVWGRVRDIDTTDWEVGDVLYASPSVSGEVTNVKPTAPQFAIPVAAVLTKAEEGELFVRPTIEQAKRYGTFSHDADITPVAADTAYTLPLNTVNLANGITIEDTTKITVEYSGLYKVAASFQLMSGSSNQKNVYFWLRKNGVDIPYSARITTMNLNNGYRTTLIEETVSLSAEDYIELVWAASLTGVTLKAATATAFSPAAPSVQVSLTQIQQ